MNLQLNTLYLMDNMEGMAQIPDKYFELAIVDPPYGLGIDGQKEQLKNKNPKHNRKHHAKKGWDSATPEQAYFDELLRVSKHQIIWGANYFLPYLNTGSKGWVVWYKGQEGLTMSDAELAYSSFDSPTRVVKINRVELQRDGDTVHPTQKPVKLYKWLLTEYAKPGDKILDTHVGSGSSLIACEDMGFDWMGFEIDPDYHAAATKRLQQYRSQTRLFDPKKAA